MEKIILCLILVSYFVSSKYVTVESPQAYFQIKSNQVFSKPAFPGLDLNNIRVKQLSNKAYHYSTLCSIKPSHILSKPVSLLPLQNIDNSLSIISSIQQIKTFSKPIIDIIMFQDRLYSVFRNKSYSIHKIEQSPNNNILKSSNNIELNFQSNNGYLVKNDKTLLYVSKDEILYLNSTNNIKIHNYQKINYLKYTRLFEDDMLFISTNEQIIFYHLDSDTLELSQHLIFNISQLLETKVQIQDFYYQKDKQKLVIVDYFTGAYFFDLSFHNENIDIVKDILHFIDKTKCQNVVFENDVVYLTCPELIKYNMTSFQQNIKQIKLFANDLLLDQGKIIIVGESYLQLHKNWETKSLLLKVQETTKLITNINYIIYINREGIKVQQFDIQQETLVCSRNQHKTGVYEIVLYGQGKCNQSYLKQNNIQKDITYYDICNYEKTILIQVWQPQIIKWVFVSIGSTVLVALLIILFVWCCIRSILIRKQYNVLVETQAADNQMDQKSSIQPSVDIDITGRQIS